METTHDTFGTWFVTVYTHRDTHACTHTAHGHTHMHKTDASYTVDLHDSTQHSQTKHHAIVSLVHTNTHTVF